MKDPIMLDNEIEGINFKTDTIFKLSGKHFTIKASKTFRDKSDITTDDHADIRFAIVLMHDNTLSEVINLISNSLPYSFSITKFATTDSNDEDFDTENVLITSLGSNIIKSIVEALLNSDWWHNNKNYKEDTELSEFDKVYDIIHIQIRNLIHSLYIKSETREIIILGKDSMEMITDKYSLDSKVFLNDI